MFAFVKHGQTVSVFVKSIAFLDSYGNRRSEQNKRLYKMREIE